MLLLSLVAIPGSTETGETGAPSTGCITTPDAVLRVAHDLIASDNAKDVERVLGHYAGDAVFLTPNGEVISGRENLLSRYEAMFRDFSLDLRLQADEVAIGFPWSFIRGATVGELRPMAGGEPTRLNDTFLMILHCDESGKWKVARLMWAHKQPTP